MSEQRKQILAMLAEGRINADEAERLIAALERTRDDVPPARAETRPSNRAKYLRVVVDDRSEAEPTRVNVRVPIQLLRAGVKLASLIPPRALDQANDELRRSGVPIDLTQLKPEHIEDLIDHLGDLTVDVEDPTSKVHVFCEERDLGTGWLLYSYPPVPRSPNRPWGWAVGWVGSAGSRG